MIMNEPLGDELFNVYYPGNKARTRDLLISTNKGSGLWRDVAVPRVGWPPSQEPIAGAAAYREELSMAITIPTKYDMQTGLALNIAGIPQRHLDRTFNSYLLLKQNGHENHTLTLELKIFMKQASTYGLPIVPHADFEGRIFWIRPWPDSAWVNFQQAFKQQCHRWNDRFWLIPPDGFSKLDVNVGTRKVRPNIYCHLSVDLIGSPASAHHTIEVVDLDERSTAILVGKRPKDLDGGDFRSDSSHFSSLDVRPSKPPAKDESGHVRRLSQLPIVHEIGHALGLPHIGVSHHDPLCQIAMVVWDHRIPGIPVPAILRGGKNSDACYGDYLPPALKRAENVMGAGMLFDETNAQPWVDRVALHTVTNAAGWRVSLRRLPPKPV
jgi:hypothetical protein